MRTLLLLVLLVSPAWAWDGSPLDEDWSIGSKREETLRPYLGRKPGWTAPGKPPGWSQPFKCPGCPAPFMRPGWAGPAQPPGWPGPNQPPGYRPGIDPRELTEREDRCFILC